MAPTTEEGKTFALLTACSLSIGTHFGSYLLGPLKSRLHDHLHTTDLQFSLMTGALSLPSTVTPLIAGLVIGRIGVVKSAMIATATSLIGQIILLIGDIYESVPLMAIGLFIFGLSISPLSVCQESLIFHLFPTSSSLHLLLSLGLLLGKLSSFLSSLLAVPLDTAFGEHAPFAVSVALSLWSCGCSVVLAYKHQETGQGGLEERVRKKKGVRFEVLEGLGVVFWWYILMNVLSGAIWQPFLHLSSNIIQHRYDLSDGMAAAQSSLLLSGAIILYPLVGSAVDRFKARIPSIPFGLFILSSGLTMGCYAWLNLPPDGLSAIPGMVMFAAGSGMSTLLMVILVPFIVPTTSISAALGLHKAMEMSSSTITLVLAGLELDWKTGKLSSDSSVPITTPSLFARKHPVEDDLGPAEILLKTFLGINVLQFGVAWGLLWLHGRNSVPEPLPVPAEVVGYERLPLRDLSEAEGSDAFYDEGDGVVEELGVPVVVAHEEDDVLKRAIGVEAQMEEEGRGMGRYGVMACLGYIGVVWVVFWASAVMKLTVRG